MTASPTLHLSRDTDSQPILTLEGAWDVRHLAEIESLFSALDISSHQRLTIDGHGLTAMDISAGWLLVAYLRKLGVDGMHAVALHGFHLRHTRILELVENIRHPIASACTHCGPWRQFFQHVGRSGIAMMQGISQLAAFFGQCVVTFTRIVRNPARLRLRSTVYHINEIGIRAVPIVALMAFLLSIVMGYQGSHQLQKFGAVIFTVDLVAISLLREMGVIITAILVAGRSGSAFAAQIGVMQVNEEVDAMRSIGLDPFELLVLPRLLAVTIALPILTLLADVVGLLGALVVSVSLLDISSLQFIERLHSAVTVQTLMIGLVKAPVFALLIGMVGCMQGLQVRNSAAEVGERTTIAVVQAIFLVVLFDALFSIMFTMMGI